jgi:hypothetical protein
MVDLQVRQDVEDQDLFKSTLRHPVSDDGEDDGETEVGDEDLGKVFRLEDDGRGGEVCRRHTHSMIHQAHFVLSIVSRSSSTPAPLLLTVSEPRVPPLSTGIPDQISGPSEQLLNDQVVEDDNGSITDSLLEFFLSLLRDAACGHGELGGDQYSA